jgi:hypothetical protein
LSTRKFENLRIFSQFSYIICAAWGILAVKGGASMKEFKSGTKIVCGAGAVQALQDANAKKLLVVTDPFFAKNGMAQKWPKLQKRNK